MKQKRQLKEKLEIAVNTEVDSVFTKGFYRCRVRCCRICLTNVNFK